MFAKINVNGQEAHPVYQFLRFHSSLYNPKDKVANEIPWNFAKFLVNKKGEVIGYWGP
jgi:glutathione peroxidase